MTPYGILFLGGAKRVSMARHFKRQAETMGLNAHLYSYELSAKEPIAVEAKILLGLRWDDPAILDDLHRCVIENGINMIVPFVDGSISVATAYRDRFGDVFVPAGTTDSVTGMFDKKVASRLFMEAGIAVPRTATVFDGRKLIAKPRRGSASKGIKIISSEAEFDAVSADEYLVQEFINGREWTVDCYRRVDNGRIECISPRTRDIVMGGEVCVTTVHPEATDIIDATHAVLEVLDLRGAVTVQFIEDENGAPLLMEVNPRFGGGAVATIAAGVNLPHLVLNEATGHPASPLQKPRAVIVKRYMEEVAFPI